MEPALSAIRPCPHNCLLTKKAAECLWRLSPSLPDALCASAHTAGKFTTGLKYLGVLTGRRRRQGVRGVVAEERVIVVTSQILPGGM